MRKGWFWRWALAISAPSAVALSDGRAVAQEHERIVELHGFGSWAYGKTDGNEYLSGNKAGRYDDASLTLNVTAQRADRLRIVGQGALRDGADGTAARLDYAFAEWKVSDRLHLRAGKVKQPFGISTEVFDVGTLRPFVELPQAVYGGIGLVGETYKGVGVDGSLGLGGRWSLNYDLYFGGQELQEFLPPESVARGEPVETTIELERTRNMAGGRAVVETPVSGLTFGASVYTGREILSGRRTGLGFQAEYLTGPWSIRTEFAHETVKDDLSAHGFYVEAAYRFDRHWQAAVQHGRARFEPLGLSGPVVAPSLFDHGEWTVGLNYWWDPNFVFKASYHHVDGNRLAGPAPGELEQAAVSGGLRAKTNLALFGAQFSF